MAVRTKAALAQQIATLLADNSTGDISEADVRSVFTDCIDSLAFLTDINVTTVEDYVSTNTTYDSTAHTLTFSIAATPTLRIANGVYFVAPSNLDKDTSNLTIHLLHNLTTYLLYDSDLLHISANELSPGHLYEARVLLIGGAQVMAITERVVSSHGRFDKYLLYMGESIKNNLPTEANFLDTSVSAYTRERFAQFPAAIRTIDEDGRMWFACPFDDIERILIEPYSLVGDVRADFGTPAIGGQTESTDPYPITINGRQFYAYGDFYDTDNPLFFAQADNFYDMQRY